MRETMRWEEVRHATQLSERELQLMERYAGFPARTCGAMGRWAWPRAEVEAWLRAHPVTVDPSLQHELALCEGLLGRGDTAMRAAVRVNETVSRMAKALRRGGFRFPLDHSETVALGLIVAGSLVEHDLLMQGFFSGLIPCAERYRDLLTSDELSGDR